MSFPVIGATPAVPVHQFTKTVTKANWTNGQITVAKSEHGLDEPVVSVQKKASGGKHEHVTVSKVEVNDTSKDVTVIIPIGSEFDGKIIVN